MNGRTSIDSTINPSSAYIDKKTWGLKYFNITFAGKRLVKFYLFGIGFDFFRVKWQFMKARINNAFILYHPFGAIVIPARKLHNI